MFRKFLTLGLLLGLMFVYAQDDSSTQEENLVAQPISTQTSPVVVVEGQESQAWFGISTGFPLGATFHYGLERIPAAALDLRVDGAIFFASSNLGLDVTANLLYNLELEQEDLPIDIYVGGGPGVGFRPVTETVNGQESVSSQFSVDLQAIAGFEYRLTALRLPNAGVFLETGPAFVILPSTGFGFVARVGVNYHF